MFTWRSMIIQSFGNYSPSKKNDGSFLEYSAKIILKLLYNYFYPRRIFFFTLLPSVSFLYLTTCYVFYLSFLSSFVRSTPAPIILSKARMSSNCKNQQQKETEKKTFRPHGNQISNEWRRKKPLFLQMAIKSGKNGNEKKNFCNWRWSNQERMETGKKTFVRHASQIRKEWKRKKLKMKPGVHRCQTKCGYACSKCPLYKASRGEFLRMLILA